MVRLIIWVVVGLLALSFFGISLRALYESPTNQENLSFLGQMLAMGWNHVADFLNYLVSTVTSHIPGHSGS
jgi:hypothetical protein